MRNDNSSRFGKYIKLQYNEAGRMMQANTVHFLLEKSRLVSVADKERNYHVFYQVCKGMIGYEKQELMLKEPADYKFLAQGKCITISDEVDDCDDFKNLFLSMQECGVSDEELDCVWRMIAAILHLGNVTVEQDPENDQRAKLVSPEETEVEIEFIAELLGVDENTLQMSSTMHSTKSGRGSATWHPLKTSEVEDGVQALIKYMYHELFGWLVAKINEAHQLKTPETFKSFIGILDIFGFEIMKKNSFEQVSRVHATVG